METASRAVLYIAEAVRKIHCPVALYIIERLKMPNAGMLYNMALDLNGMQKDGPSIVPIGEGDRSARESYRAGRR